MAKTLGVSATGHLSVLALWGIGFSVAGPMPHFFPADALEVSLDPGLAAGTARQQPVKRIRKSAPQDLKAQRSELDLPTAAPRKQAEPPAPQIMRQGQGGTAHASQASPMSEWDRYRMQVRARIHEALQYPRASRNLGETGQVRVRFTVLKDGTIVDVAVAQPSAFDRLNWAAENTVRRVARVDPLPTTFNEERWDTFVPLDFRLR